MTTPLEREFPGDASSVARARGFVTTAITQLLQDAVAAQLCEDAELIVSELVTNAVRAEADEVTVILTELPQRRLAIQVRDTAEGWPEPKTAGIHDTGGRGLAMVSAVSSAWGVRLDSRGKTVWAELDLPADAPHS